MRKNTIMLRPATTFPSPKRPAIVTGTDQDDSIALTLNLDGQVTAARLGQAAEVVVGIGPVQLLAGAGYDRITVGESHGLPPPSSLLGEVGNDLLSGGSGADTLDGGIGDDTLTGGASFDALHGDAGNDVIMASCGTDEVSLGEGDNRFGWSIGAGDDEVEGGAGTDTIRIAGSSQAQEISVSGVKVVDPESSVGIKVTDFGPTLPVTSPWRSHRSTRAGWSASRSCFRAG